MCCGSRLLTVQVLPWLCQACITNEAGCCFCKAAASSHISSLRVVHCTQDQRIGKALCRLLSSVKVNPVPMCRACTCRLCGMKTAAARLRSGFEALCVSVCCALQHTESSCGTLYLYVASPAELCCADANVEGAFSGWLVPSRRQHCWYNWQSAYMHGAAWACTPWHGICQTSSTQYWQ